MTRLDIPEPLQKVLRNANGEPYPEKGALVVAEPEDRPWPSAPLKAQIAKRKPTLPPLRVRWRLKKAALKQTARCQWVAHRGVFSRKTRDQYDMAVFR